MGVSMNPDAAQNKAEPRCVCGHPKSHHLNGTEDCSHMKGNNCYCNSFSYRFGDGKEEHDAATAQAWTTEYIKSVVDENTALRLETVAQAATARKLAEALEAIRDYEPHAEVAFDEFAYHRMVERFRRVAESALAAMRGKS